MLVAEPCTLCICTLLQDLDAGGRGHNTSAPLVQLGEELMLVDPAHAHTSCSFSLIQLRHAGSTTTGASCCCNVKHKGRVSCSGSYHSLSCVQSCVLSRHLQPPAAAAPCCPSASVPAVGAYCCAVWISITQAASPDESCRLLLYYIIIIIGILSQLSLSQTNPATEVTLIKSGKRGHKQGQQAHILLSIYNTPITNQPGCLHLFLA